MNKIAKKLEKESKRQMKDLDPNKRRIRLQYIMLFILIGVTAISLALMSTIRLRLIRDFSEIDELEEKSWHYVMIAEDVDSSFWQEAYAGARAAAERSDAVVELVGSAQFAPDESLLGLDRAIAARCDGIATCVTDQDGAVDGINKAIVRNIPVVTMEYDAPASKRQSFVGVNSFNLGQTFGQLLVEKQSSGDAVLLVGDDSERSNIAENLIMSGIQNVVEKHPDITLGTASVSRASAFSAEEAIRDLLLEQRPLDTILCLNVQDTLRCVEALVDFNKTDQVSIICYQDNADVLEYVRSGIVYSAISSDAWQMGFESIQALTELKTMNRTSEYIPSRLVIINQSNIDNYQNNDSEAGQ
ncbi:MAG: sugar ABC transporter substrate-binding protein [Clostridiaceae bacterium]|nr:sugar ABC transporter substrate-binding protein [Clostridiaceae bacterium]